MVDDEANHSLARKLIHSPWLRVDCIRRCGNCNSPATTVIAGYYYRCQRCANHLVNLWNEMRSNINDGQQTA